MNETFLSAPTEYDASTSARELLLGTTGPFVATTPLGAGWDWTWGCAEGAAAFALKSSAHDFGTEGLAGDEALGVSSALVAASKVAAGASDADASCLSAAGDLVDCCAVEAALGALADLIGISGTAGLVVVRACLGAEAGDWAVGAGAACARSTSDGGCEVDGVSTSPSEGTAAVDACDSSGPSVGVRSLSSLSSAPVAGSSKTWPREGRARPASCAGTMALFLLLRPAARAGKSASGTDSQGSGG